ncbi:hypothetical protein SORBI_3007G028001 [Sorghum bicolor]|uniref:Uncharacterized protein n=1 Tax=Sorghum bicolor TaxID=4558 RepID=A0A1Z5R7X2_SORBI|nr:hypothetical protein SORBI_3007G028001 [Sorghum bicolor]
MVGPRQGSAAQRGAVGPPMRTARRARDEETTARRGAAGLRTTTARRRRGAAGADDDGEVGLQRGETVSAGRKGSSASAAVSRREGGKLGSRHSGEGREQRMRQTPPPLLPPHTPSPYASSPLSPPNPTAGPPPLRRGGRFPGDSARFAADSGLLRGFLGESAGIGTSRLEVRPPLLLPSDR